VRLRLCSLLKIAFLAVLVATAMTGMGLMMSRYKSDWGWAYRPAVLLWLEGESPYLRAEWPFANPPWVLPFLAPFALLPMEWGRQAMFYLNLGCYIYLLRKLKAGRLATAAFLLTPTVVFGLESGQIEGLLSLGYVLPPALGLFFMAAKPQMGIGLAVYWMVEAWRLGGWRKVLVIFAPVGLAVLLSAWAYPDWIETMLTLTPARWNRGVWPQGIPVGAVLLALAIRQRRKEWAIGSSVFFAPYLAGQTWATGLVALVGDGALMALACAALWVVFFLNVS